MSGYALQLCDAVKIGRERGFFTLRMGMTCFSEALVCPVSLHEC